MAEVTVKSLSRNSIFAVVTQIWRIGTRLILTPLIISRMGMDGYGTWTLLFAVCAYVNLTETSFGLAYAKLTAEHDARGEHNMLSQIIASGVVLVGSIGLLGMLGLWLCREPLLLLFGVRWSSFVSAGNALMVVAFCVLMRMSVGCVFQVLAGLQRMDLHHKTVILSSAVEFAVSIFLIYRGWKLMGLAIGHLCGQLAATVVAWRLCRRLCPGLRISPWHASRLGLEKVVSLGMRFQVLSVVQLIAVQGSKLVISALAGVATLGIFELAHKLLTLGAIAGQAVIAPLMPAFANLHAGESADKLRRLHLHGSRVVSVICVPTLSFLALFADRLIVIWTGEAFPEAAWTIRWLAIAFYATLLTGVVTSNLRGRGSIRLELTYAVLATAVFFVLCWPGYHVLGYAGIIYCFVISSIVGAAWLVHAFSRSEGIPLLPYLRETLARPLVVLGPAIVPVVVLVQFVRLHLPFGDGRLGVMLNLMPWAGLFGIVVTAAAWFGLLAREEREVVIRIVSRRLGRAPVQATPTSQV